MNHFLHPQAPLPDPETLQVRDITELFRLARLHAVYPIVYEALQSTPAFRQLPAEQQELHHRTVKHMVISQTQRSFSFLNVYRQLLHSGVTPLVMKGIVLRELYGKPDFRSSADEDLLIRPEEFGLADRVLTELGFQRPHLENPLAEHEITFHNSKTAVHLEVHLSLFPRDSGAYGRLNREFSDVFDRQVTEVIQGTPIHTLAPEQHMLYLLCHGLKHFLHSGFGIRQLCDMVRFAEHYGSAISWPAVQDALRRQNMEVFAVNLCDIAQRYLGFCPEKAGISLPKTIVPDSGPMLEDLLCSGVYGKSSASRVHSATITLQAAESGRSRSLPLRTLFPGLPYMKKNYPYLERRSWLLPLAWIQRAGGYLRRSRGQEVSEAVSTGNHRVALLKKYGILSDPRR